MNVRKVIPFAVAAAIVLAACGGAATPAPAPTTAPEATQAPEATATTAAEPTAAAEATATTEPAAVEVANPPKTVAEVDAIDLTGKNVEVLFWHRYSGSQVTKVLEIANDFNQKNPYGITVKLEQAGASYDDVYNKINASIQGGGDLPALSIAYQNQAALYRSEGVVIDLTPFIQSTKYGLSEEDLKDFFPYFLESDKNPQFPGEVLGWRSSRSMEVLYSNLDWLKELGATEPPKTLKEFEDLACKASNAAEEKYGWIWKNDASDFASLVFANGGSILKADASGYDFNSPAAVEALTMMQRMFKNGCAVELPVSERFGEQNRFAAGKLLFVTASSSGLPFYASSVANAEQQFKWTISMHPQANADQPVVNLYGASWSVLKTTPEQELAAWLFMKYFTEKEQTAAWATTSNYMAVRQSAAQLAVDNVKQAKNFANYPEAAEAYGTMYEWIQYGAVESPVAGYDPVRKLIQDTVTKVAIKGEGDPQAELDAAVEQANDILKEYAPKQ
ncbi:MAG: extracellular solute-binding protein [Chloroflexi bacterium]|nr:extracellular solute-binding protein [Chloroflexota bacterium]